MEQSSEDTNRADSPRLSKNYHVVAREISLVFVPEHLTEVMKSNPEELQAVRISGGYVIRLRPKEND